MSDRAPPRALLKLFEEDGPARHVKLVLSQPFSTGVVYLVYAPDPNPPTGSYDEAKGACLRSDEERPAFTRMTQGLTSSLESVESEDGEERVVDGPELLLREVRD